MTVDQIAAALSRYVVEATAQVAYLDYLSTALAGDVPSPFRHHRALEHPGAV